MLRALTLVLVLIAPALTVPALAAEVSGPARVIDGDTVVVGSTHVRLKGVDAAELNTAFGQLARFKMIAIVGTSTLTCELTGERTYNRQVGYCFRDDDGVDINQAIVEQGFALACPRYSTAYVPFETVPATLMQKRAAYCTARRR